MGGGGALPVLLSKLYLPYFFLDTLPHQSENFNKSISLLVAVLKKTARSVTNNEDPVQMLHSMASE